MSVEDDIERLNDAGLLTERQAEAFVLRDLELVPREATADEMGISVNTLDNRLAEARRKVDSARRTIDVIRHLRHEEMPTECADCGATLGGSWSENDDGEPICLDCAGIASEDAL